MGETTIEWTATRLPDGSLLPGYSFNPWVGCQKLTAACDNCYAEAFMTRKPRCATAWSGDRFRTSEANWRKPLSWDREAKLSGIRRKVFCASLADVFDNQVDPTWRADLWKLIAECSHLDWLLLTKRPQNIAKMLPDAEAGVKPWGDGWPNVWLGTTAENRREGERRTVELAKVRAVMRFWSCEPLLEDLGDLTGLCLHDTAVDGRPAVGWIIAGGESGPGARPSHPEWFRSLRDQCATAGVPFFFKQWGDWREFDHGSTDYEVDVGTEMASSVLACARSPGWVTRDGRFFSKAIDLPEDVPCRLMERIGKKAAGSLLDGVEHKAFPT